MPKTLSEKIFSKHSNQEVKAGDFIMADLDLVMAHDTTCSWAVEPFEQIADRVWDNQKIFIPFDHAYPAPNTKMAALQNKVRKFASQNGIKVYTDGVCHQLMAERLVGPGNLILGADSHTPTSGAMGAITIGVGSTDAAIAMATGKCWFKVPGTIKINVTGELPAGVFAKDVVLRAAGDFGPEGGAYHVMEWGGPTVEKMNIPDRLTLTNMSAEMGAEASIVAPDEKTIDYLKENKRESAVDVSYYFSEKGSNFARVVNYDVSDLKPLVAKPHDIDNVDTVENVEKEEVKVDQVFIGSCTNCRIQDLEVVYQMWQNYDLNPEIRVIITPASKKVYLQALNRGYVDFFMQKGAIVTNPGCGPCLGRHGGVLSDGEVCVSTSNRNFKGRMGSSEAFIYLASPATAAATAITGKISDPRKYLS
jgi:3-isopropylmalate/(R)-2-methylmalate dehydratase large subunit